MSALLGLALLLKTGEGGTAASGAVGSPVAEPDPFTAHGRQQKGPYRRI